MRALVTIALSVVTIAAGTAAAAAADMPASYAPRHAPAYHAVRYAPQYYPQRYASDCYSPCRAPEYYVPRHVPAPCSPCRLRLPWPFTLLSDLPQPDIFAPRHWRAPWHHHYHRPTIGTRPWIERHRYSSRHHWRPAHRHHHRYRAATFRHAMVPLRARGYDARPLR